MNDIYSDIQDEWVRPWDKEKSDSLYYKDERFFGILMKGVLAFLNKTIILNGESINHFIFNTGSSYMYVEKNGYEFSWCETTGEDGMYMKMPRCVVEMGDVNIDTAELTSPYVRGNYERLSSKENKIIGFNAEVRRLPIELSVSLHYVLSTTNESLILVQEIIDKMIFQKYFNIVYLGQKIKCSIEFPQNQKIEFNKIDMSSADVNQKTVNLEIKVCSNYPIINVRTEVEGKKIIAKFGNEIDLKRNDILSDRVNNEIE